MAKYIDAWIADPAQTFDRKSDSFLRRIGIRFRYSGADGSVGKGTKDGLSGKRNLYKAKAQRSDQSAIAFAEKGCREKSGRGDEELRDGKPVCGQRKRQSISLSLCDVPRDDDRAIYDREQGGREKRDR